MSLPADISTVAVTGTFVSPSGAAMGGHVTITSSVTLTDGTGRVVAWAGNYYYDGPNAAQLIPEP